MKNKIKISNFAIIKTLSALRISKIQDSMAHAKIVAASFARIYGAGTEQEIEEFAAFSNGDFTKFNLKNKIRISLDSLIIEEALDHPAGKVLKKIAESFSSKTEIEKKIFELLKTNK